jgi:phosphopantothenoylcysteine decarboxylase/phosphopantothenate--cysteine ligase
MDANMFHNPAFQSNLSTILKRGFKVVGPNEGYLSSGEIGKGRMSEPQEILGHISWVLGQKGDLEGRSIVISAGGTHEPIDPVRILTNRSSGKMGYAIAEAARDRGANVTLVSASTNIPPPVGVRIRVANTVEEMKREILGSCAFADAVIMAAAISDFRVSHFEPNKIKRKKPKEKIQLLLEENEDFSNQIPKNVIRIGFAAETENLIENAKRKLTEKNLAFIVANDVTIPNSGFEADTNQVTIIDSYGSINPLPLISKFEVGHHILDKLHSLLNPGDRKS